MIIEKMTVAELFKCFAEETPFKVSVHDLHWKYLETTEGDSAFWVNLSEPDEYLQTLQKVYKFHVFEWWVHVNSGTLHITVVEDIA